MNVFSRFNDLHLLNSKKIKLSKKFNTQLEKDAIKWFEITFGAVYHPHGPEPYKWHYSGGTLCFTSSLGDYYYSFVIKMTHYQFFKDRHFVEGFNYARKCLTDNISTSRDDNPYKKVCYFYDDAWDAGYICGLSNFKFKPIEEPAAQECDATDAL